MFLKAVYTRRGCRLGQIVWVDRLANGFLEYYQQIITNACLPELLQKSLYRKLLPTLPIVYGVANAIYPICSQTS